jgi:hypothetical protein
MYDAFRHWIIEHFEIDEVLCFRRFVVVGMSGLLIHGLP